MFGHSCGLVYADRYISEIGNDLAQLNQDLEFIVLIDMGRSKISLRGITDTNLCEIAKRFGGGGHAKASGFSFSEDIREVIFKLITGV